MRVARLLIYEGEESFLQEQLGRSMNDGVRTRSKGVTITCLTLPYTFLAFCEQLGQDVMAQAYLQGERTPPSIGKAPGPYGVQHAEVLREERTLPLWKLYRRLDGSIGDAVPAIQWTGDIKAVQAFVAPDSPLGTVEGSNFDHVGVHKPDGYGLIFAHPGDWLVKVDKGCEVYPLDVFMVTYEPVPSTGEPLSPPLAEFTKTPEYVDGIDITKETEAAPTLWKCPGCGSQGFAPKTGTRATGISFEGCEFCVNEDGAANL